ncbi:nuclear transport factor 2 family protein [Novosphingobium sp.]|uniref:nuclear transport factor 2 family protein n=1 Tax=Novosphingobium sp. TaxID=1874826 RepID=UPI002FD8DB92
MTDREEIYDLMIRYGRAVDMRDVALLRTCFTDDVIVDYKGAMDRPRIGIEDFVAFFRSGLSSLEGVHMIVWAHLVR